MNYEKYRIILWLHRGMDMKNCSVKTSSSEMQITARPLTFRHHSSDDLRSAVVLGVMRLHRTLAAVLLTLFTVSSLFAPALSAADLSESDVKLGIERGKKFLIDQQKQDGSWSIIGGDEVRIGVSSLAVMALLNSGMSPQDAPARRGLQYLRSRGIDDLAGHFETYQTSLLIMALVAGKERSDFPKIAALAQRLEDGQLSRGNVGGWSYRLDSKHPDGGGGDESNSQFAVLGLKESVEAGFGVNRKTWERIREYWIKEQCPDGGWGYGGGNASKGSMTVAGVSSLSITQQMLQADEGVQPDGSPPCCQETKVDVALQRGLNWLGRSLSVHANPGSASNWMLYYIYGVERAGRLSGQRFFGEHDWYREGTAMLLSTQNQISGSWVGAGIFENSEVLSTSYALLFLSKGLAPVLINKLKYGPRHPNNPNETLDNAWNRHPRDVRNLTELISSMPKWPKLLTTQELDLARAVKTGGVNALLQSRVLFITGPGPLVCDADETKLLKEYLEEGGFIFACPSCHNDEFEASFRTLIKKMLPPGEGNLNPLPPDHPVYRSEHPLQAEGVPLYGVDFGCRTSIIYSPEDLACLWDYWAKVDPPNRNIQLKAKIIRATQIGVNVIAYATGREPPDKTQVREVAQTSSDLDSIERGLLQIAQIKHEGTWNAAPRALRNLLISLNENVGLSASTKMRDLELTDKNLFRYPIVYMHGRNKFTIPSEERKQLRMYLERGGVLFADSCCGAKPFDKSFRDLITQLFPERKMERIPITHELFTDQIGHDVKHLNRRTSEGGESATGGNFTTRSAEPILEGIELDGRYCVIYSKYDISCALERQNSGNCEGYLPEDAVKLGTNIIRYAMLQNLRLKPADGASN